MYERTSPFPAGHDVVTPMVPMSWMMIFAPTAMPSWLLVPIGGSSEPTAFPEVEVPWPEGHPPLFALSLRASASPPVHGSIPWYGLIGMYRTSFRRERSVVL